MLDLCLRETGSLLSTRCAEGLEKLDLALLSKAILFQSVYSFAWTSVAAQATSPAAASASGATPAAAAPSLPDKFFLSLLPDKNNGIRQFTICDAMSYLAHMDATFATFSAHAISIETDLELVREACACLHWIQWPGRVSYAALPDTVSNGSTGSWVSARTRLSTGGHWVG